MGIPKTKDELFSYSDYLTWNDEKRWEIVNGLAYNLIPSPGELNLMFKELDKFIAPFEYTHADFYKDYMNSRVLKDLRGIARAKKDSKAA